jgi:hypothetical protein
MAYGIPGDLVDDLTIGESTTIYSLRHFAKEIITCFVVQYVRASNAQNTKLAMNAARGVRLIACARGGRTFYRYGMDISPDILKIQQSSFRRPGDMVSCLFWNARIMQRHPQPLTTLSANLAKGETPKVDFEANMHKYTKMIHTTLQMGYIWLFVSSSSALSQFPTFMVTIKLVS